MSRVDEMDTLDILIKLEFPTFASDWKFGNYILGEEQQVSGKRSEIVFRFRYDQSIIRYGLGAVSAYFLPLLSYHYEESPRKKTDYDISSLWSALVQQFNNQVLPANIDQTEPTWVQLSRKAIERGNIKLCKSGVGGTYFAYQDQTQIAVFKPIDEEPGGPNNPKSNMNFIPMLPWGTGAHREVAASRFGSFAGVPSTFFVEININGFIKRGSLQQFVPNEGDCSDFGANKFSVDTVHRLGILDICILNMDRNDENLLILKGETEEDWRLVPIDHTYSFPNKIDSYFNWQYWPQTKKPFSPESLSLISSFNVITNSQELREIGIDEESIRNVTASTLLLQRAADKGFTLSQIAKMISGNKNDLVDILTEVKRRESEYSEQLASCYTASQRLLFFKYLVENVIDETLLKTK